MKKLILLLACFIATELHAQNLTITGEKRQWHNIVLTFNGPNTSEGASTNPFTNFRMDVTFTHSSGSPSLKVPGYFAACGNAQNNGCTSGNKWRVHFRPNKTGTWNWTAKLRKGNNIAAKTNNGQSGGFFDGDTGSISVSGTNKNAPDFRARGRLNINRSGNNTAKRYMKFQGDGSFFLKFGPDSPENFLDYEDFDFDGARKDCGKKCTQHSFGPHVGDWNSGDPQWNGNKGRAMIGAINYLSEVAKVNSISMSVFGGDDKNIYPWTRPNAKTKYDISKLAQWEVVFNHAEKKGILLHFKLSESENTKQIPSGTVEHKIYYREMVARFGHHLALEWNIGEEFGSVKGLAFGSYAATAQEAVKRANYLHSIDPWDMDRVLHTGPGKKPFDNIYAEVLKDDPTAMTGASMQSQASKGAVAKWRVFTQTTDLISQSTAKNSPWAVATDEQGPPFTGTFTDEIITTKSIRPMVREDILWGNLMAGGAGVMWFGGSNGDFLTEDYRRFSNLHKWSRFAITTFFKGQNVKFWLMKNNNGLVSGSNNRCLARVGQEYVVQLPKGGSASLNLSGQSGTFKVRWFNPRNGKFFNSNVTTVNGGGNRNLGNPPNSTTKDWIVHVKKQSGARLLNEVLEESSESGILSIYPNPFQDIVTVELPSGHSVTQAVLFNTAGVKILAVDIDAEDSELTLDLGSYNNGIYFLRLISSGQTTTHRLIKQ